MDSSTIADGVARARRAAGLNQRALAQLTGITQPTLSRIENGSRVAKMDELIQIAAATGSTVSALTGTAASQRVRMAARTQAPSMESMRRQLLHFIELDAYLEDQAVSAPSSPRGTR